MIVEKRQPLPRRNAQSEFIIHMPQTLRAVGVYCAIGLRDDGKIAFYNGRLNNTKLMTQEEFAWFFLASFEDQQEYILKRNFFDLQKKIQNQEILLNIASMAISWIVHSLQVIHDYSIGNVEIEYTPQKEWASIYPPTEVAFWIRSNKRKHDQLYAKKHAEKRKKVNGTRARLLYRRKQDYEKRQSTYEDIIVV